MIPERKKKDFSQSKFIFEKTTKKKKYGNEIQLSNKFPLNLKKKKKNLKKRVNSFNFFLNSPFVINIMTRKKKLKENIITLELLFLLLCSLLCLFEHL